MKIKLWIIVLVNILLCPIIFAEDKYKGSISVNIKEDGGSVYATSTNFETLEEKDVVIISRRYFTEQKEKYSNQALNINPSKLNYYYCIFNINDVNNDIFKAEIKLYSLNKSHYSKKLEGINKENLIVKYEIEGILFTENKYFLSDKDKPDINVILEFDKIFSSEEIKERLQQKHTKT